MGETEARLHLDRGEEHLQRGEWLDAEGAFRQAVALHATSAVGWSKLGVSLARQQRLAEAIEALRQAIQLNPRYAPAYSNLGNVYREQGQKKEAMRAYQRAIEMDPEYWIAHQNLGALYKETGRLGEAVTEFRKATRLSMRGGRSQRRGCLFPAAAVLVLLVVGLAAAVALVGHLP